MIRPNIAIIHPQLIEGGGSEAPALWTAEALKNKYNVHLITMGNVNLDRLNEYYGTSLNSDQIKTIIIPIPYLLKNRFDALRVYRLTRFCKQRTSEFDLIVSTYNVMDFGRKGIQYISDFSFNDRLRQTFDPTPTGMKWSFHQPSPLRWMYLKLSKIIAGTSRDGWKRNVTIANSDWSGKIMKDVFGMETQTIYPPVVSRFPDISWNKREDGFVCIGRLVPEKRIDRLIEILSEVRKKGCDVHFHIIGKSGDAGYIRKLQELCKRNSDWVFMEGSIYSSKKLEFIAQHKYGIHGREKEPFGIAVAEMVNAGCIAWVPNGGGQSEIVNHYELVYDNAEDAANKIEKVLKSTTSQIELRKHLAMQSEMFSNDRFMDEIRNIVDRFFNRMILP